MVENSQSNFVKIIREICGEEKISCISYSSDWAFQLEKNKKRGFILGYQFGLNRAVAQQISADKSVASEILTQNHVPNVEHRCFMAPHMFRFTGENGNWEGMKRLLERYGNLVCKDNQGTGGHLVFYVTSERQLEEAAETIFSRADAMAISPYCEIAEECRVVVLDGRAELAFEKVRAHLTGDGHSTFRQLYSRYLLEQEEIPKTLGAFAKGDRILKDGEPYWFEWKHNLGQGAFAKLIADPDKLEKLGRLACQAAEILQLRFASVDLIRCEGSWKVLEVNSGVMMENLAGMKKDYYQKVKEIYRKAILTMLEEG